MIFSAGLLTLLVVVPISAQEKERSSDEKELKKDLARLQGKWEHTFKQDDVNAGIRKIKEIKGNTEKVTWYLADGSLFMVNTVEFKLEKKGKDKYFTYFNGKVVEGENKGAEFQDGSYVYLLDGDSWTEILETGDGKIVWKRIKAKK
jgi:hypothetical protein